MYLHSEQGIGDEIIFSRIFNDIYIKQNKLIIEVDKRIIPILKRTYPLINFVEKIDLSNCFKNSKHISVGSVGKFFRNKIEDFKSSINLKPDDNLILKYKKLMKSKKIKIGVSWLKFSPNDPLRKKSFDLIKLSEIFSNDSYDLINLQYGNTADEFEELKLKHNRDVLVFESVDYKKDLDHLAAIIYNCDLVVSVESFAAIYAGSIGKKVYLLASASVNFTWVKTNKNRSLWFQNVEILRQSKMDNWQDVIYLLKNEIQK